MTEISQPQPLTVSATQTKQSEVTQMYSLRVITLRPYQLLCLICMLGERESEPAEQSHFAALNSEPFWEQKHMRLDSVLQTIQQEPDIPITLRCNAGGVFHWQDPGTAEDSPEGEEYNLKRDLDILRVLDLAPGATLPARSLLYRMQNHLKSVKGICGYDECSSCAWKGCAKAAAGFYERGNQIDIDEIVPVRTDEQRAQVKDHSMSAVRSAKAVRVRPHLLMCAVCQYGIGVRPPFHADNLPEFLVLIREKPDTPVTMVPGADWMMCGPCKRRDPDKGSCVNVSGLGGLSNDLRDLNVLQLLDMKYGDTMPAIDLYKKLFDVVATSAPTCSLEGYSQTSVWWDVCRPYPDGNPTYTKGRALLNGSDWLGRSST